MRAIGFRVEPKAVHYAVITVEEVGEGEEEKGKVVAKGKFSPPASYTEPQSLKWYRDRAMQEIDKHEPDSGGVRYPEVFGRKGPATTSDHKRLRIEGVLLETLVTKGIDTFGGATKQISSAMGSGSAKAYKAKAEVRGIKWDDLNDKLQDAVLAALASIGR